MKTGIGEMRFHVVVQKCTNTKGSDGAFSKTWDERCSLWCDIRPMTSTEVQQGRQVYGEATHAIRMRHDANVLLSDRVVYGSKYYYITSIANVDTRGRFMELSVKESQA